MAFDATLPQTNAPIVSAELRAQFNALQDQITVLQQQMVSRAHRPSPSEFDPGFSDPPTSADLLAIQTFINDLVQQLTQ